jgi:serine/threonine protein kinase
LGRFLFHPDLVFVSTSQSPAVLAMGCATSAEVPSTFKCSGSFKDTWMLKEKIGQGAFAQVRTVEHKTSGQVAAAKMMETRRESCSSKNISHAKLQQARKELSIWMRSGRHENIVALHQAFEEQGSFIMVMERCELSLEKLIEEKPNRGEKDFAGMFLQMLTSIAHVHSMGIVHRDVKPANFLCGRQGQAVKLCDFGMAAIVPGSGKLYGTFGTAPFMSPEMVGSSSHGTKTDVWSLGASFYLMIFHKFPYQGAQHGALGMQEAIFLGLSIPDFQGPYLVSEAAISLVSTMLHRQHSDRITSAEALQSDWFKGTSDSVKNLAFPVGSSPCPSGKLTPSVSTFADNEDLLSSKSSSEKGKKRL